ncbi:MAG TPA: CBS domain-containing protein [Polyangiaceae bacterium]|nr:CBS domain-containing protein [Polyangiaceae bacterium]
MKPIERILEAKGRELSVTALGDTVLAATEAMCAARVGSLLVMDGDALRGIFSERDLLTRVVLARRDPSTTRVGDVMTTDVVCIAPDLSVRDAMGIMTERRVRHLPVVLDRRVIGLVSIGDLVRWTLEESTVEIDHLRGYVEGRYPG